MIADATWPLTPKGRNVPRGRLLSAEEARARGPCTTRGGRTYGDDADIWLREHDPRYGRRGSAHPRSQPVVQEPDPALIAPELLYAEW